MNNIRTELEIFEEVYRKVKEDIINGHIKSEEPIKCYIDCTKVISILKLRLKYLAMIRDELQLDGENCRNIFKIISLEMRDINEIIISLEGTTNEHK